MPQGLAYLCENGLAAAKQLDPASKRALEAALRLLELISFKQEHNYLEKYLKKLAVMDHEEPTHEPSASSDSSSSSSGSD